MDECFGFGCNICYKTDDGSLKDISEENMKHLKDILITFVGHADIIKYNEIYLCQLCCQELIRFDIFRELCFSHLIQLQQKCFNMLSKLDLDGDNNLKTFVHEENSVIKCDESRVALTNEEDLKNVMIRRSEHTKLETFDVSNVSDNSQIQFIKEEIDLNNEIFTLISFETKSDEQGNPDVKEPVVNDSSDSMKEELHLKQEKSNAGVKLETTEDEFGNVHVGLEIATVSTNVNVGNGGNEDIGNQEEKIGMKLRRRRNNKKTVASRAHVREGRNGRSPTALQATESKRLQSGAKLHTCVAGNQSFKTRSSLVSHERIHSGGRPYKSAMCNKAFTQPSGLIKREPIYNGDLSYKCTVCNKPFKYPSALIGHERMHSGDKPYNCTVCNKAFAQSGALNAHKRIHSGDRPYKCSVCNKAFTLSSTLTVHERTHSGDKPYICTLCNKAFAQSGALTAHKRLHSGDKPYKCSVCNKAFSLSTTLTKHKRIHSGDRPYKCSVCNKAFAQSGTLTKHKRLHSRDRPYISTV